MGKRLFLILLVFTSPFLWGKTYQLNTAYKSGKKVVEVSKGRGSLNVSFYINHFEANQTEKAQYKQLHFPGLRLTSKIGHPSLPYHSFLVASKASDLSVQVELGQGQAFKDLRPLPAQEMPCRSCKEIKKFSYQKHAYEQEGSLKFRLEEVGDFRGIPLTRVITYPVSYQASKGLNIYANASFRISHQAGKPLNYFESSSEFLKSSLNERQRYLIATPSQFILSLESFIKRKKSQGFLVELVTLEEMGNDYESVKAFLHDYYKNPKTRYEHALIVGHEDLFPTNYIETQYDKRTPSDLSYFLMGGEGDEVPDVFYGRLVVSSQQDINNQLKKFKNYEEGLFERSSGYKRMIGIASDEGMNPTDVEYMQQMMEPLIKKKEGKVDYFFQRDETSRASNINQALNKGASWMNYIGHGLGPSWTSLNQGEYHTRDIAELQSGKVKPVIIDVACQNGRFSLDDRVGERFMNSLDPEGNPIGAVAYYGGSVDISWHPPAVMAVGISQAVGKGELKTLGEVLLAGQLHLLGSYDDHQAAAENLKWYHLLGDPTLQLRFHSN